MFLKLINIVIIKFLFLIIVILVFIYVYIVLGYIIFKINIIKLGVGLVYKWFFFYYKSSKIFILVK